MSSLVTAQLAGTFEQATFSPPNVKPPKGWKKFDVKYREAHLIISMDQPMYAVYVPVCPGCDSPRFYMDEYGWIWLKEKGFTEADYVCACIICGCRIFGLRPKRLPDTYFKRNPKFRRHRDDQCEGDMYVDEETANELNGVVLKQLTGNPEVEMMSARLPADGMEVMHGKKRRHGKA